MDSDDDSDEYEVPLSLKSDEFDGVSSELQQLLPVITNAQYRDGCVPSS